MINELEELAIELIENEGGEYLGPDQLIAECGADSFGVVMIVNGIDEEFPCLPETGTKEIDWSTITLNQLLGWYNGIK